MLLKIILLIFFIMQDLRACCIDIEAMKKKRTRKMAEDLSSNCLHWDAKLGVVFIRQEKLSCWCTGTTINKNVLLN